MTDLLIDIGNSRIKWAISADGQLRGPGRAAAHNALEGLFAEWLQLTERPSRVRMVNVAKASVVNRITAWLQVHWELAPELVHTPSDGDVIHVAYSQPHRLGADRWLAMLGARAAGCLPACVVDCGTAITVDVVDSAARHQGGLILPGFPAQQAGLARLAPGLPSIQLPTRTPFLATDTAGALASGHIFGTAAAVQGVIRRCLAGSSERLTPVLTGGDAPVIARYLELDVRLRPDLVLEGLASLP
ncbi:type III pantothenate kinase [Spiribacter vilamensis]|uniref:Type III pantothenate kinase n=1 Tax=Spiribacter vilamensis TaxID=531306 RepID=A0A4Q8D2T4_9GAMM|nr:type III pantothenate kinase [Spiribacter vilamensis]RZU99718.1 type III pantothenate kinase [Spiribacter vilamensis]TVO61335.1 type III pantothenate kinase [Spiribacter vilamensis]